MNPRSVAIVGAGNNPLKMSTVQAVNLLKAGYAGKVYFVHPKEKTVHGHKAYPSVADLPEVPDLALLIIPSDLVAPILEEFGRIGTRRAIIITAGFKEIGDDGKTQEEEVLRIARKYGIRFIGPNCMGIINTQLALNTTIAPQLFRPGSLGLASQSGTYMAVASCRQDMQGVRFSKMISLGNEADITMIDALEYLGEDEKTKAIILYIEGIREGRRFIKTAQRITPHKPVLALYVGGSEAGARSGMSHTGALAGPDFLYDGIFKQAGIIRVRTLEELYAHGWALAAQPPLRGNRLGILTNSGGPGTSIAHVAAIEGLEVPIFSETLQKEIQKNLPAFGPSANPVDMTFNLSMKAIMVTLPEIIMQSGEVDGLIIHGTKDTGNDISNLVEKLTQSASDEVSAQNRVDLPTAISLPGKYGVPLFISSFYHQGDSFTAYYQDHGISVFDFPEKAAEAMATLLKYKRIKDRKSIKPAQLPHPAEDAGKILRAALTKGQRSLDEHEAKKILAAYGIPIVREMPAQTVEETIAAARNIGFPIALKGCSPKILHKTGKGLIRLNLQDETGTVGAFQAIQSASVGPVPVLVQQMISGSRELLMGTTRFPGFGPVLLFGLGGIFAEALKDAAFRSAPLSLVEAEEMAYDFRAQKILKSIRGMPAVDMTALADILQKLSFISVLHPEIVEMDLNPLIVSGDKPVVVDALIILEGER